MFPPLFFQCKPVAELLIRSTPARLMPSQREKLSPPFLFSFISLFLFLFRFQFRFQCQSQRPGQRAHQCYWAYFAVALLCPQPLPFSSCHRARLFLTIFFPPLSFFLHLFENFLCVPWCCTKNFRQQFCKRKQENINLAKAKTQTFI